MIISYKRLDAIEFSFFFLSINLKKKTTNERKKKYIHPNATLNAYTVHTTPSVTIPSLFRSFSLQFREHLISMRVHFSIADSRNKIRSFFLLEPQSSSFLLLMIFEIYTMKLDEYNRRCTRTELY